MTTVHLDFWMASPMSESGYSSRADAGDAPGQSFGGHLQSATAAETSRAQPEPEPEPTQANRDSASDNPRPQGRYESPSREQGRSNDQENGDVGRPGTAPQPAATKPTPRADDSSADRADENVSTDQTIEIEAATDADKKTDAPATGAAAIVVGPIPVIAAAAPIVVGEAASLSVVLNNKVKVQMGAHAALRESAGAAVEGGLDAIADRAATAEAAQPEQTAAIVADRATEVGRLRRGSETNSERATPVVANSKPLAAAARAPLAEAQAPNKEANEDNSPQQPKPRRGSRQEVLARAAGLANAGNDGAAHAPVEQPRDSSNQTSTSLLASGDRWMSLLSQRVSPLSGDEASVDSATAPVAVDPADASTEGPPSGDAATNPSPVGPTKSGARQASATTVGDAEILTPGDRARLVQRVARAFQSIGPSGGTMRMRLSPPELGQIKLEVSLRGGALTARLEAETQETRRLLTDNLPELRQRLAAHDVRIESVEVDVQSQSQGGFPQQAGDRGQEAARQQAHARQIKTKTALVEETAPSAGLVRRSGPGHLNIVV